MVKKPVNWDELTSLEKRQAAFAAGFETGYLEGRTGTPLVHDNFEIFIGVFDQAWQRGFSEGCRDRIRATK